jgi:hypothetical protein
VLQKSLSSHSILHVFDKNSISTEKAEKALIEDGYFLRIAKGRVSAETQEWHFIEPSDPNKCKQLLKKIVDDPEFLRYYSKYTVLAPNGELLGRICDYITMGQA